VTIYVVPGDKEYAPSQNFFGLLLFETVSFRVTYARSLRCLEIDHVYVKVSTAAQLDSDAVAYSSRDAEAFMEIQLDPRIDTTGGTCAPLTTLMVVVSAFKAPR
jgi:hypothetical protein